VPHRGDGPRWLTPEEVAAVASARSADPGLRDDLERLAGETTEDLGPPIVTQDADFGPLDGVAGLTVIEV